MSKLYKLIAIGFIFVLTWSDVHVAAIVEPEIVYEDEQAAVKAQLKLLAQQGVEPGTYEVYIRVNEDGRTIEKAIHVTVRGEYTVVDSKIAMDAKAVEVSVDQVGKLTAPQWISMAQAHAWRTDTLANIAITGVDFSSVLPKVGTYQLTFSVGLLTTTVPVHVVEHMDASSQNSNFLLEGNQVGGASMQWNGFAIFNSTILRISFIFMLFLPLAVLLFQYFYANKVVQTLIRLVLKRK